MTKPRFKQVSTHKDLVRDTFNNGIINTNKNAADAARKRYKKAIEAAATEKQQRAELNTMRKEIDELKAMVRQLMEMK